MGLDKLLEIEFLLSDILPFENIISKNYQELICFYGMFIIFYTNFSFFINNTLLFYQSKLNKLNQHKG